MEEGEKQGVGLDRGSDPGTDGLRRDASTAALRSDVWGPKEPIPEKKSTSQTCMQLTGTQSFIIFVWKKEQPESLQVNKAGKIQTNEHIKEKKNK